MSIADRLFGLRNRVLSDVRFQRWAAGFPLTKFIARKRASALFDLSAGFVYSQVLQAVVRLRVLEILADGPLAIPELAARLSLSTEAAERLLEAAASLKIVERRGRGMYGLGIHGAAFLGNPGVRNMVEHHSLFYRDLEDPVALLRGTLGETKLRSFWAYANPDLKPSKESDVAAYSELMAGSLSLIADDILEAYSQRGHRCLLDVGGGKGAFLEYVATRAPHLALILFDLPPVARLARERIVRAGLASRTTVVGGDIFTDALPSGADIASLIRVIHDHDDAQALVILRAVRHALPSKGVLLLAEPMRGTRGAEAVGDAYFGLYLLAMGQGRPRSFEHLRALVLEAGFGRVQARQTRHPMLSRLLVAEVR